MIITVTDCNHMRLFTCFLFLDGGGGDFYVYITLGESIPLLQVRLKSSYSSHNVGIFLNGEA